MGRFQYQLFLAHFIGVDKTVQRTLEFPHVLFAQILDVHPDVSLGMLGQIFQIRCEAEMEGGVHIMCHIHHPSWAQADIHLHIGIPCFLLLEFLYGVASVKPYLMGRLVYLPSYVTDIA